MGVSLSSAALQITSLGLSGTFWVESPGEGRGCVSPGSVEGTREAEKVRMSGTVPQRETRIRESQRIPNGRPGCVSALHFWQLLGSLSVRTTQVLPQTPAPACPLTSHAAPHVLLAPALRQQSVPSPGLSLCVIRAREPRQSCSQWPALSAAIPLLPPLTREASRVAPSTRGPQ